MPEHERRSGQSEYLLNGEPTEVYETWQLLGDLAGECQISSRRTAPGVRIDVEAHMTAGRAEWFEVAWQSEAGVDVWALYKLCGEVLQCSRRQGDGSLQEDEILFIEDERPPLLFPLMRIFTGPLIASLLEMGGEGDVAIPAIADPTETEQLLQPRITRRRARVVSEHEWLERQGESVAARCCEYLGDQYEAGSRFWLGEQNLLLRYSWQQAGDKLWDVWCVNLH